MTTHPPVARANFALAIARRARRARVWTGRAVFCAALAALTSAGLSAAEPPRKSFDIPAGTAPETLKQFSAQAGGHLLYSAEDVEGARTNAVKGMFTSREVIDRMLTGTGLVAKQDEKTGALAITSAAQSSRPIDSRGPPPGDPSSSAKKKAPQT